METFADVLHKLIDTVLSGDVADKAHSIIDNASGTRTAEEPEPDTEAPAAVEEGTTETPAEPNVPDAAEEAPPTPGG